MRTSTAYFAGAGTIIAAIVGGVGGGLLFADMVSPKSPKVTEMTKLERRMSAEPIQVAAKPSEPVPYIAAPQLPTSGAAVATVPAPNQAPTETINSASTAAQPTNTAAAPQPAVPAAPPVTREPVAVPQTVASDDTVARARDLEMKRAAEKRRAERRQQWTDRRRYQLKQQQELQAVEESVREETGPRRTFAAEPVSVETRRIRVFDAE
jgi:hypothetical protein